MTLSNSSSKLSWADKVRKLHSKTKGKRLFFKKETILIFYTCSISHASCHLNKNGKFVFRVHVFIYRCWVFLVFVFWGFVFVFVFVFLGPHPWHLEVPRLGIETELQLPAYTKAIATWDPSHVCDLHHSSQQCQILNPLIEARDRTQILIDTSQVCYCWATMGTPRSF